MANSSFKQMYLVIIVFTIFLLRDKFVSVSCSCKYIYTQTFHYSFNNHFPHLSGSASHPHILPSFDIVDVFEDYGNLLGLSCFNRDTCTVSGRCARHFNNSNKSLATDGGDLYTSGAQRTVSEYLRQTYNISVMI